MDDEQNDSRLTRLGLALWRTIKDYALTARSEKAGLETLRELTHRGPLSWLGLAILLANLVVVAYLAAEGHRFPLISAEMGEGQRIMVPSPALYLALFFVAFGWAYLLTGAALFGPGVYSVVAVYAAFYGLFIGINLSGSFLRAVLPLWLLFLGSRVAFCQPSKGRWLWLLFLTFFMSVEVYPAIAEASSALGKVFLLAAFSLVSIVGSLAMHARAPSPAVILLVNFSLFAIFYALTMLLTPSSDLLIYSSVTLYYLLGYVALFWYWLGLDVLNDAKSLATWMMRTLRAFLSPGVLRVVAFTLWALWCIWACWLVYGLSPTLESILGRFPLGEVLLRASMNARSRLYVDPRTMFARAVTFSLYATIGIAVIALVLLGLRRLSSQRLTAFLMLSLAGFVATWGVLGLEAAIGSASEEVIGFWPMLILFGGMFWQVLKVSADLIAGGRGRSLLFLGFLLLLGGISLLELFVNRTWFQLELSTNALIGLMYLGIPYVLYQAFYGWRRCTPIPSKELVLLFALGMLSAIPALFLKETFLVPVLWLGIILGTVWRSGSWDDHWDGVVYLVALALGFVVFYTNPIILPLAYLTNLLPRLFELQMRYLGSRILPWEARWWWMLLSAVGAASIQGCLFFKACRHRGRVRWLFLLLGTASAAALLALAQPSFVIEGRQAFVLWRILLL